MRLRQQPCRKIAREYWLRAGPFVFHFPGPRVDVFGSDRCNPHRLTGVIQNRRTGHSGFSWINRQRLGYFRLFIPSTCDH